MYTDEELLEDLKSVATKLGKSPTFSEYEAHGQYGATTLCRRFGTWNKAKRAADLDLIRLRNISKEELLKDLKRVAAKLNKSPTQDEYKTHGQYGLVTLHRKFETWNKAKRAADLDLIKLRNISGERLLRDLRQKSGNAEVESDGELFQSLEHGKSVYHRKFGGIWQAHVRAGQIPSNCVPLSEEKYDSYIQTAVDSSHPSTSLYGLIRGFTGLTSPILNEFRLDWISRVGSDLQPILVRVPSKHVPTADHWELVLPDHYTTATGDKKPTHLKPILQWIMQTGKLENFAVSDINRANRVINKTDIDTTISGLRATVATHLGRRGVSKFKVEMQVGAKKTNWHRSVRDYFLYLYQFENYCHPDYEPSGTYLDPESGNVKKIESEAN